MMDWVPSVSMYTYLLQPNTEVLHCLSVTQYIYKKLKGTLKAIKPYGKIKNIWKDFKNGKKPKKL